MQTFKRIFLFIALNFLICVSASAIFTILGLNHVLARHHVSIATLFLICFVYGMCGAFISLLLSRVFAKWMMGIKVITAYDCSAQGVFLKRTIEKLARKANLPKIPEIGIFISSEPNAFATGPTASRSLVAVSTGLLQKFDEDEIEAVLGHEIAHIQNGDMITMTLLQGIVNTFVFFLSYVIAEIISRTRKERSHSLFYITRFLFRIAFMILGSIVVAAFSRRREFKADLGGANLTTKEQMIRVLRRLENYSKSPNNEEIPTSVAALMYNGKTSFLKIFSSHPSLAQRIEALQKA